MASSRLANSRVFSARACRYSGHESVISSADRSTARFECREQRFLAVQDHFEHGRRRGITVAAIDRFENGEVLADIVLDAVVALVERLLLDAEAQLEEVGHEVGEPRQQ